MEGGLPVRRGTRNFASLAFLTAVLALLMASLPSAAADSRIPFRGGLGWEYFSRRITWDDKSQASSASALLITGRGEIELRPGLTVGFAVGLSLSNFNGLVFRDLPISLDYEAGAAAGLVLGAGGRARLLSLADFEIEGEARFVYSLGFKKSWPVEGFTVPGEATGKPTWVEVFAGPRVSYLVSGKFVPYLSLSARLFSGNFELAETLGDLDGQERKNVRGKSLLQVSLGADYRISGRFSFRAEAGFLPYPGGVDGAASAGLSFLF
jgi:hypothetical protein